MSPRWVVMAVVALLGGGAAWAGTVGPENRDLELVSKGTQSALPNHATFVDISSDGARIFFHTAEQLVPEDQDTVLDLYERSGGTTTLVTQPTGVADPGTDDVVQQARVSNDGSRVFFRSAGAFTSDDNDGGATDIFERSGGTTTRVTQTTGVAESDGNMSLRGISRDGSRVFFTTTQKMTVDDGDAIQDAFVRFGGVTELVTTGPNDPGNIALDIGFLGVSGDGSRVAIETNAPLTSDDTDTNHNDVFVRNVDTNTTVLASRPGPGQAEENTHSASLQGVARDGEGVFFSTQQEMTTTDQDVDKQDVFEFVGGQTRQVSLPAPGVLDPTPADSFIQDISRDGTRVYFSTTDKMTADDQDSDRGDIYERSGGQTTLVSGPGPGVADPDSGEILGAAASAGGRIFFETTQVLTAEDNDVALGDVYEHVNGETRLVTQPTGLVDPGTNAIGINDIALNVDGSRVFFATPQRMTVDDEDGGAPDVFERAGGVTSRLSKPVVVPEPLDQDVDLPFGTDDLPERVAVFIADGAYLAEDGDEFKDIYSATLPPPPPTGETPDTVRPVVSNLRVSPRRSRIGNRLPRLLAVKTGTRISFRLSEAAQTVLRFERARPGRRVRGRCVKPTRRNRARRRCTRYVRTRGRITVAGKLGANRVRFQGRISRTRRLRPGAYRVVVTATDEAGNTSAPKRAKLRLLPKR